MRMAGWLGGVWCGQKSFLYLRADTGFLVDTGVHPLEPEQCRDWIVEFLLVTRTGIV
jgi:hypothetical protein